MESRGDVQRAAHLCLWEIRRWFEKCPYRGTKRSARLREGRRGQTWITLWRERGREQTRGWCIYVTLNQRVALFQPATRCVCLRAAGVIAVRLIKGRRGGRGEDKTKQKKNCLVWTLTRAEPKEERLIRLVKLDHCVPLGGVVMGFQTMWTRTCSKNSRPDCFEAQSGISEVHYGFGTLKYIVLCGHVWCDWQSLI